MAARATIDHEQIRRWVEERGGHPARVKGTNDDDDVGLLRIDYPGFSGEETLEAISWDEWFKGFEQHNLAFLYDPRPNIRFSKLVDRDEVELEQQEPTRQAELPDVVELIQMQHDEVRRMFRDGGDTIELLDKLSLHLAVEQTVVYPALLETEMGDQVREAFEEHINVLRVIADIIDGPPEQEAVAARMRVLQRLVEEHMQEEERDVLPKMERLFDEQRRRQLARGMLGFAAELTRDMGDDAALETALSNAEVPAPI